MAARNAKGISVLARFSLRRVSFRGPGHGYCSRPLARRGLNPAAGYGAAEGILRVKSDELNLAFLAAFCLNAGRLCIPAKQSFVRVAPLVYLRALLLAMRAVRLAAGALLSMECQAAAPFPPVTRHFREEGHIEKRQVESITARKDFLAWRSGADNTCGCMRHLSVPSVR